MARGPQHKALVDDMGRALLSELGARVVYARLSTCVQDEELTGVLTELAEDENGQIRTLQELMRRLGGKPRSRSFRRWFMGRALVSCRRLFGPRFAMRVCLDAEWTVSRWYAKYAAYLTQVGETSEAQVCEELALTKRRHSRVLQAWVDLSSR